MSAVTLLLTLAGYKVQLEQGPEAVGPPGGPSPGLGLAQATDVEPDDEDDEETAPPAAPAAADPGQPSWVAAGFKHGWWGSSQGEAPPPEAPGKVPGSPGTRNCYGLAETEDLER